MRFRATALQQILLGSVASGSLIVSVSPAMARENLVRYNIPPQAVENALRDFGLQNGMTVLAEASIVRGKRTAGLREQSDPDTALRTLLKGTGLTFQRDGNIFVVKRVGNAVQTSSQAVQAPTDSEIVVTAQKKEEKIIDVPIAMTALSNEALDDRKIEGGSELLRAIPNVNFSKSNFSMYNFSIRGIGTKAISASSDPAVAVSFNNTPLVRNRLFEAEFFDMQRVEVLRGPQGTLYGRNATAGVVNMIPAMPGTDFLGEMKGEVGNFKTKRISGMLNVPLSDALSVRVSGAATQRDGFDFNTFSQKRVNGRDLYSTRAIVAWDPGDRFRANLIWQHFNEDDDRSRTGKQLCHTDPGPEMVGNVEVPNAALRGKLSQGCLPGSIYDDAAYGVPNGDSLVYMIVPSGIVIGTNSPATGGARPRGTTLNATKKANLYEGLTQSKNLREISTSYDPVFRAKNDILQLNMEFEPSDGLKIVSQSAYARDKFYSTQDYNRFATDPIFNDSAPSLSDPNHPGLWNPSRQYMDPKVNPGPTPGGVYCDEQLGCSDRMISADLMKSNNRQWSQEVRLQSDFSGPFNFNIGANYLDFKTKDNYYVFNNLFTFIAEYLYGGGMTPTGLVKANCPLGYEKTECINVEKNSLENIQDTGHNYFLSKNNVHIKSLGLFGEVYYNFNDQLKLTVGARYTNDRKRSSQIPSQLLLGGGNGIDPDTGDVDPNVITGDVTGGRVNSGYPALPDIHQQWGEFTGRLVLDWKPDTSFSDDTLVYLSLSRGYKGGGTNPPRVDFNPEVVQYQFLPGTFEPEFINALEIGTKNSFAGGRFTLNANAFFYDYKDYQISQIVDRISYNENFDANIWGAELEAAWRPSRAFRVDGNLGYLKTRLKKGAQSIDVMDRTQGDPDWVVVRPWLQVPSNCIAPRVIVEKILASPFSPDVALASLCPGSNRVGTWDPDLKDAEGNPIIKKGLPYYSYNGVTYNPLAPYNPDTIGLNVADGGSGAPNGGRGFFAPLEGNELPNSPRWTLNIGAQYTFFLDAGNWELTFRGDYYRQSKSYARVYNTAYDRLRSWDNVNAAITLKNVENDLSFQLYAKNIFNNDTITDFFTNSDDTGLTTNVFTLDPRIISFSVSKSF